MKDPSVLERRKPKPQPEPDTVTLSSEELFQLVEENKEQKEQIKNLKNNLRQSDLIKKALDYRISILEGRLIAQDQKPTSGINQHQLEELKVKLIEELANLVGEDHFWSIDIQEVNNIVDRIFNTK